MILKLIKRHLFDILLVGIAMYSVLAGAYVFGCINTIKGYEPEIDKLKQENKKLREQNVILEKNQVIIYHADNWGGTYKKEVNHEN